MRDAKRDLKESANRHRSFESSQGVNGEPLLRTQVGGSKKTKMGPKKTHRKTKEKMNKEEKMNKN